MTDYQIEANTRRCAASGRALKTGDRCYSVLVDEGGKFRRLDYSNESWTGPPEGTFSFWISRIPAAEEKRQPVDDEMLLDCFRRLEGEPDPGRLSFRYVVALLLLRRKQLRFEDARMDDGREIIRAHCP